MTRAPSTCGCSPRVRSGHPPREDRASNLVGPVRDVIGLVGWRRLFLAVRHIRRKWATCTPSMPRRPSWTPQTRGGHAQHSRRRRKGRARRARRRGCKCGESRTTVFARNGDATRPHGHTSPHAPARSLAAASPSPDAVLTRLAAQRSNVLELHSGPTAVDGRASVSSKLVEGGCARSWE